MAHSFAPPQALRVGGREFQIAPLGALAAQGFAVDRLPYSLRILLENLLRRQGEPGVTEEGILALAGWKPGAPGDRDIAFMSARVLL